MFPPIPSWEALHPSVVHFPLALLSTSPLFVLLALVVPAHRRVLLVSALVLMGLGTAAAVLAVETGEAAEEWAEDRAGVPREVHREIHEHSEAGERARNVFAGLTVILAGLVLEPMVRKRPTGGPVRTGILVAYLLACGVGVAGLANTGHLGGRLVHVRGVRAPLDGGDSATQQGHHEADDE